MDEFEFGARFIYIIMQLTIQSHPPRSKKKIYAYLNKNNTHAFNNIIKNR